VHGQSVTHCGPHAGLTRPPARSGGSRRTSAVHGREDGAVHTVGEHRSLARGEADHVLGLLDGEVHGGADGQPVVVGGQPVHHLDRGVFDHVGDDLAGDLLGDDEPLTVGADLGEQAGEQLDRVGAGGVAVDAA
jgi:hypothetical protein